MQSGEVERLLSVSMSYVMMFWDLLVRFRRYFQLM
jgi:hypothetical protein